MTGKTSALRCLIPLPPAYRAGDILAFHRRDPQEVAERVGGAVLEKGVIWQGQPACLHVDFQGTLACAILRLDGVPVSSSVSSPVSSPMSRLGHRLNGAGAARLDELEAMVKRMLGLSQGVEAFEARHGDHPDLGKLITRQRGLRVPATATPFEALTWAITGQQISVAAAVSLRRKLIQMTGLRHADGLLCHPDAAAVAALPEPDLRQAGFSSTKASTLLTIARMAVDGALPLDAWARALPVDEIRAALEAIRGIGPWTVNYTLLRGFGWLDGSLHGDVAVRRSLQALLGEPEALSEPATKAWLEAFAPWRALVAAHLWAARSAQAY